MTASDVNNFHRLRQQITALPCRSAFRLGQRLHRWQRGDQAAQEFAQLEQDFAKELDYTRLREQRLPQPEFPPELPVSAHVDELVELIQRHQVVVVSGETGSGKSTQLPKICLQAGRGIRGLIAHTQPRRIAARAIAARLSEELKSPLGEAVGYRVRFNEQVADGNYIRVLTDGMLLAECERDRFFNRYDTIIIDEAHERSLNIDFLMGILKTRLAKRPDMRLIITSATLDTDKFSRHFAGAPIVEVSGRTYPVSIRYQFDESLKQRDALAPQVLQALDALFREQRGDTLVFLPGERDINDVAYYLQRHCRHDVEVLPLYARLSAKDQQKVMRPGPRVRVILSTNVAETSLTVPRIRYVIDSGLARVSRYSPSRKVQRLPIERISQAAANQRSGRCGRVSDGICIRLFAEDDFAARPLYSDPEIKRTSLAGVILRMLSMGLGDIADFPFVDAPLRKQINDGLSHLQELAAIDEQNALTEMGRRLASLPIDPRLGRMLIAASETGCVAEVCVIVAALSIPDPRVSQGDNQQKARQAHAALSDARSDFVVLLDIWLAYHEAAQDCSRRQLQKWCDKQYLSAYRMHEWQALYKATMSDLKRLKLVSDKHNEARKLQDDGGDSETLHRALLTGLLSHVAYRDEKNTYIGANGKQCRLFPASKVAGNSAWIVAAEMVETQALYARTAALIKPHWIETAAAHLLRLRYSEPYWDRKQGRVSGFCSATLYGLNIFAQRRCDFGKVQPALARPVFIMGALVEDQHQLSSQMAFMAHNQAVLQEVRDLEARLRRHDLLVDDHQLLHFYNQRIPQDIITLVALKQWLKKADETQLDALNMQQDDVLLSSIDEEKIKAFPEQLQSNGIALPLRYRYAPGESDDGVNAQIDIALLNLLPDSTGDCLVPGLFAEKLLLLLRQLPKTQRRQLVPLPQTVNTILPLFEESSELDLATRLSAVLKLRYGVDVKPSVFCDDDLPTHLRMSYELIDSDAQVLQQAPSLADLQRQYGTAARQLFSAASSDFAELDNLKRWSFGVIPSTVDVGVAGHQVTAYPALEDRQQSVALRLYDSKDEALTAHSLGVVRLLLLQHPILRKAARKPPGNWTKLGLLASSLFDLNWWRERLFFNALRTTVLDGEPRIMDEDDFNAALQRCQYVSAAYESLARHLQKVLQLRYDIMQRLSELTGKIPQQTVDDIDWQLNWLIYDEFVDDIDDVALQRYPRYLQAIIQRLDKAAIDPPDDILKLQKVMPHWQRCLHYDGAWDQRFIDYRWAVEEWRVSVFAQTLGTQTKVSPQRLEQLWQQIVDNK